MGGSLHTESAARIAQILFGAAIVSPILMFLDRTGRWAFASGCLSLGVVFSALFFLPDAPNLGFGRLAVAIGLIRGCTLCGVVGMVLFVVGIMLQHLDKS
jgi:hypothetical protein